ncbi:MAG: NUDIX domain-containing protein [Bacteroidetes bacterium]|nr:NUDIX domain-containing protein [Bacteroidota bacterium]
MYKVFHLSKPIIFIKDINDVDVSANYKCVNVESEHVLHAEYQRFIQEDIFEKLLISGASNVDTLFEMFKKHFKNITAAGGIVRNSKQELLVIFRNGKWDLPKGKLDPGEKTMDAALREVEEETGIGKLKIIAALNPTFHIFKIKGQNYLKKTFWYQMESNDKNAPVPQTSEGIELVKWMNKPEIENAMRNTYHSLIDLFDQYLETI